MNRTLITVLAAILPAVFLFSSDISFANWIDPRLPQYHTVYPSIDSSFFPRCPRPRGGTQAFYKEGTHAIVGDPVIKVGADIVFSIGNDNYVQCYCPAAGGWDGTQTNWLATTGITQEKKEQLLKKGWYYIENGADWRLKNVPYLAQNSDFLCVRPLFDPNK